MVLASVDQVVGGKELTWFSRTVHNLWLTINEIYCLSNLQNNSVHI